MRWKVETLQSSLNDRRSGVRVFHREKVASVEHHDAPLGDFFSQRQPHLPDFSRLQTPYKCDWTGGGDGA